MLRNKYFVAKSILKYSICFEEMSGGSNGKDLIKSTETISEL